MTTRLSPRRLVAALAAVAGVVVAHAVDYLILFPGGDHRSTHLQATGHGYWPVAVGAAVAAGAVAAMLVAARGSIRPSLSACGSKVGWRELAAWQTGAFLLMEAAERVGVGLPWASLVRVPELWLGLLLQVPVAWLVARLLRALEQVAAKVAAHRRPDWPRSAPALLRPSDVAVAPRLGPAAAVRLRGPPPPRPT